MAGGLVLADAFDLSGVRKWSAAAKPTTRPDGSALVAGDVYYDTGDKFSYFWDATTSKWLSTHVVKIGDIYQSTAITATYFAQCPMLNTHDIYITSIDGLWYVVTTNDDTHYWTIEIDWYGISASGIIGTAYSTVSQSPDAYHKFQHAIDIYVDCTGSGGIIMFYFACVNSTPAAGTLIFGGSAAARWVKR